MTATHYAFSDDSCHVSGRYNSLALVSLAGTDIKPIYAELNTLLSESGIAGEFKWEKVKNAKYKIAAQKLVNFTFKHKNQLRIDILIWNLNDYRHTIDKRDDIENLVRMYYHLSSTTFTKRWPITATEWAWYPDLQNGVTWNTLQNCINNSKLPCVKDLFKINPEFEKVKIAKIKPSNSKENAFIQLADFFAGLGAYSWGNFERFNKWQQAQTAQTRLFSIEHDQTTTSFSNKELMRYPLIVDFNQTCKEHKLQIALNSTKGFYSHKPQNFINFWLYSPQTPLDKAPTK